MDEINKKKILLNLLSLIFIMTMVFLAYTSKYNINTVSEYVLGKNISSIDKVGSDVKNKILANRPFREINDIENVKGIGKEKARVISINFKTSGINIRQKYYFYTLIFLIIEGNIIFFCYLNYILYKLNKQVTKTILPLITINNKIKKDINKSKGGDRIVKRK